MNIIKEFMSVMMGVKVMRLITQLGLIAVVFMLTPFFYVNAQL